MMLKNFQRYFRFYLATCLFGLLLVGIRWQAAPLGEKLVPQGKSASEQQVVTPSHQAAGDMAMR